MSSQPVNYDILLAHIQNLGIPILDFVNHLQCTFNFKDVIGEGGAMTVFKALLRRNPQQDPIEVALKIPKQIISETSRDKAINKMLAAIRQEIRMMMSLEKDPHIVTLYGIAFQDLKPILVMELATSSLKDYLISKNDNDQVTWETKARFCYEVAEGIMSLHSVNIVHGDIKADNVLLFGDPAYEDELISKLSDFGYSSTIASIAQGGGTGGTPNFWAPECTPRAASEMRLYANKPTKDNYSYGLFVWQVAKDGEVPYEDMDDVEEIDEAKHSDKELLELMELLPEDTPESFKRLIIGMTKYIPNDREDLMNVRAIISSIGDIDLNKDIKYAEAKKAFEICTKNTHTRFVNPSALFVRRDPEHSRFADRSEPNTSQLIEQLPTKFAKQSGVNSDLPQDTGGVKLKSLRSMPIPLPIKKRLFCTYEAAASKGDVEAAYFLSVCYGSGFGVKLDKTKMISWAIQAAEGGNLEGVKNIASSYGTNVEQLPDNRTFLFPWILKAAEAGHRNSQFFISMCYNNGICVGEDDTKTREWYEKYLNNKDPTQYEDSDFPEESALDSAAREGNIEAIKFFLLQESMDVNTKNSSGFTPLLLAAAYGHTEVIKMLVTEFRADLNIKHTNDWTPLHFSARNGNIDAVKLLVIEYGADVNVKDNNGETPLHIAAQNGHIDMIKLLVVEFGADINAKSNTGLTPLFSADFGGHIDIVKLLVVEFGADVNVKDNNGETPLHLAAQNGHVDIVKLFVEFGADVNAKNNKGWTPLHFASQNGHIDTVKFLVIEFRADVNVKDNNGWTPLHYASYKGHIDIVKLLVDELEADINARDYEGRTPLLWSSGERCKEVALALLEHPRANINLKTEDGQTLLHLAVKYRQEIVIKILVDQFHLDIYAKDSEGRTPLELADDPPVHRYICDGCKIEPVVGELRKCTICADFGFCSRCYSAVEHFNGEHIFKIVELPSVKHLLTSC